MLDKANPLRQAIGAENQTVLVAQGEPPDHLIQQARDLLLGKLAV
jgi:hypothetical protein